MALLLLCFLLCLMTLLLCFSEDLTAVLLLFQWDTWWLLLLLDCRNTERDQSARWMWPSSPVPPCCRRVWCVAGLLLATHFVLLSAEAGTSAVHVQPSGLQDRSCRLVKMPASFSWTCGHWVGCGPCVVSWPQPAATAQGSGSHPSECLAPGLLWWGSSFLGRWHCCLAVFLWLHVWRARPLTQTTVGWYPLQDYSSVTSWKLPARRGSLSPAVASRTESASDRKTTCWHL